jgi:hypothetical protein
MSEWNPSDPDVTSVYYDLATWSIDHRAELAAEMADAEIPHAWDDSELMVPEEFEQASDLLIEVVETRLGIASASDTDTADAVAAGVLADGGEGPQPIPLAGGTTTTEYGLEEWPDGDLAQLTHALTGAGIPFRWEGRQLLVGTQDEQVVDALLDEIETGEYVDVDVAGDAAADERTGETDEGRLPFETLTTFFLAGERLHRNPLDADGLEELLAATEVADPENPPYGVQPKLWEQTCQLADRLADALAGEDGPDEQQAMTVAGELHDLLRPYV